MKRFFSAVFLCALLLVCGSAFLLDRAEAADEDVVQKLLDLPAPPPPNPLVQITGGPRDENFYDLRNPPRDDAPIDDLIDYWAIHSSSYAFLRHQIKPSPRVAARLMAEIRANPSEAFRFLNVFRDDQDGTRLMKDIYDRSTADNSLDRAEREAIRRWLVNNSPYFADELEGKALRVRDANNYVTNHEDLLSLTQHDWDRAAPIVNRLYNDQGHPVSRIAALWALYRRSLSDGSVGDADRYRDELIAMVENKSATAQMRDLALDALVAEKEWPGRDEWYFSLLADETLADLGTYTGLTTIILNSPVEKYKDKMIELAASSDQAVRNAAVRNLATMLSRSNDSEIIRALLPWLSDANWANIRNSEGRNALVRQLANIKIPDSVPGLIHLLTEKPSREIVTSTSGPGWANTAANIANLGSREAANLAVANVARAAMEAANAARTSPRWSNANAAANAVFLDDEDYSPFRYSALSALVMQADMRAVPALRRLLGQTSEWEQGVIIKALIASGGFTIPEQVDGLEAAARTTDMLDEEAVAANSLYTSNVLIRPMLAGPQGVKIAVGLQLSQMETVSDELVRAVVDRIESLQRRDAKTADAMRRMLLNWKGTAAYSMHLRDVKNNMADTEVIIKLLAARKAIREKQPNDIYDLRTGGAVGIGLAGCMLEDANDMASLLSGDGAEATAAMLACARLIRAPLPVERVIPLLRSQNRRLALATERYLESEDSGEARTAILALYPNGARITGATTYFAGSGSDYTWTDNIYDVFKSVSPFYAAAQYAGSATYDGDFSDIEKNLQEEVIRDKDLLGVYNYENYYVRIYATQTVFSVQDDVSRYRERVLTKEEFDYLKGYLAFHKVDELPPFLSCSGGCEPRQLLMLGRHGGRRVFVKASRMPEFFQGLDSYFADMARGPLSLKYAAGKEFPGLEVLFADDELAIETVWKRGDDTRLFVTNRQVRERVNKEIDAVVDRIENEEDDVDVEDAPEPKSPWELRRELKLKREYEGIGWFRFGDGRLMESVPWPAEVPLPGPQDSLNVRPKFERWKTLAGDLEIRADEQGLYKVRAGRLTKFKTGHYEFPVVSENGRWVVANKYEDDHEGGLVRINLQTGREFKIDLSDREANMVIVYIPAVNRFLLGAEDYSYYEHDYEDEETSDDGFGRPVYRRDTFLLLNPENGLIQPAPGEYRPLTHQSFRKLQTTGRANEFWAAMPDYDKNETVVGVYDAGVFGFKPLLKIPKITFDSLDMWVDGGKVYFVYKGHLLSAPLPSQ